MDEPTKEELEAEERLLNPWKGWHPSTKKYDPNDPHFNPMHPPKDTPKEVLEKEWGEEF